LKFAGVPQTGQPISAAGRCRCFFLKHIQWCRTNIGNETVLEMGRCGTACHTDTSSFWWKSYRHFLSDKYHSLPVSRMADAGHNACKCKDVYAHKNCFTVTKGEILKAEIHQNTFGDCAPPTEQLITPRPPS